MIIVKLSGGLGNQMFQYAAGLALAEHHQTVLKLDPSWYGPAGDRVKHERYRLNCFNISEHFATTLEIRALAKGKLSQLQRAVLWTGNRAFGRGFGAVLNIGAGLYNEPACRSDPGFLLVPDNSYVCGMWQSEDYFASAAQLLRRHFSFRYPPPRAHQEILAEINAEPNAIALHIRRGDFGKRVGQDYNQPIAATYYRKPLAELRESVGGGKIFLFTDEPGWAEHEFKDVESLQVIRKHASTEAFDDLYLMAQCSYFVLSNSTFGWWAAWLSKCETKVVYAPNPWFPPSTLNGDNIVPKSWRRFDVSFKA